MLFFLVTVFLCCSVTRCFCFPVLWDLVNVEIMSTSILVWQCLGTHIIWEYPCPVKCHWCRKVPFSVNQAVSKSNQSISQSVRWSVKPTNQSNQSYHIISYITQSTNLIDWMNESFVQSIHSVSPVEWINLAVCLSIHPPPSIPVLPSIIHPSILPSTHTSVYLVFVLSRLDRTCQWSAWLQYYLCDMYSVMYFFKSACNT